jgi:hypothetical protein
LTTVLKHIISSKEYNLLVLMQMYFDHVPFFEKKQSADLPLFTFYAADPLSRSNKPLWR